MERKVLKIEIVKKSVLQATASVDHGNGLITHFWKVLLKDGKLLVIPPQLRIGPNYHDILEFKEQKEIQEIEALVLKVFHEATP